MEVKVFDCYVQFCHFGSLFRFFIWSRFISTILNYIIFLCSCTLNFSEPRFRMQPRPDRASLTYRFADDLSPVTPSRLAVAAPRISLRPRSDCAMLRRVESPGSEVANSTKRSLIFFDHHFLSAAAPESSVFSCMFLGYNIYRLRNYLA